MTNDDRATCAATTIHGERCRKRAVRGRFCLVHAGVQDMRALGKKGGSVSPLTRLRKAADDELQEEAREVIARAMRGEEVDPLQLRAAQSIYSVRAQQPPTPEATGGEHEGLQLANGKPVCSLGDVLQFAMETPSLRSVAEAAIAQARAAAEATPKGSAEGRSNRSQ